MRAKPGYISIKVFDGWTEPVKFGFRWNVFGFFWLEAEEPGGWWSLGARREKFLTLFVACTVGMLREGENHFLFIMRE